ncbi:MAG: 50S ribosomal protein L4 [Pseudomonadota bacterium]
MKYNVTSLESKKVGSIDLADAVFGLPDRRDILHQVVRWQQANRRSGNHKTKGISEIRGTTKKPWRQKGTGRARAGSLRAPQFRGGATIFGPVVRSHNMKLPKKVRVLGLKTALSCKAKLGELIILDALDANLTKTKDLSEKIKGLGVSSGLFVDHSEPADGFKRALSNIVNVNVLPSQGLNVYDILRHQSLILTKAAVKSLEERLV